jgi:hypothetical protein
MSARNLASLALSVSFAVACSSTESKHPPADDGTGMPPTSAYGGGPVMSDAGADGAAGAGGSADDAGTVTDGGVPWAQSACGACLESQCPQQVTNCQTDAACNSFFFGCYVTCPLAGAGLPNVVCTSTCATTMPTTVAWTDLQACLGTMRQATGSCGTQCAL